MQAANDNIAPLKATWASAKTMARELDIGESTFRAYVKRELLPAGKRCGGSVRYHLERTLAAFEGKASSTDMQIPSAANDNVDPIMARIVAHGAQKKARR